MKINYAWRSCTIFPGIFPSSSLNLIFYPFSPFSIACLSSTHFGFSGKGMMWRACRWGLKNRESFLIRSRRSPYLWQLSNRFLIKPFGTSNIPSMFRMIVYRQALYFISSSICVTASRSRVNENVCLGLSMLGFTFDTKLKFSRLAVIREAGKRAEEQIFQRRENICFTSAPFELCFHLLAGTNFSSPFTHPSACLPTVWHRVVHFLACGRTRGKTFVFVVYCLASLISFNLNLNVIRVSHRKIPSYARRLIVKWFHKSILRPRLPLMSWVAAISSFT